MEKSFSLIWNENKDEVKFLQRAENIFECGKEGDFGPKKKPEDREGQLLGEIQGKDALAEQAVFSLFVVLIH